jgi:beta-phosphoglucomutase-like phosphatase (HAD superfamily)
MIDTIIFDGEGVVFDSETIWDRGQREFLGRRGVAYNREFLKPLLTGRSLIEGVRVMQALYGFAGDPTELARERLAVVRSLFAAEVRFMAGFLDFYHRVSPYYKTCLATSLAVELLAVVDNGLKLSQLFTGHVFSIADVGNVGKPAPDLFLLAARRLGSSVDRCLVIEDAPLGVEAARRAGMKCVALTTTYTQEKLIRADVIVESFSDLDMDKF